jgi:ribose-phosphate pyrophosphokinase
MKVINLNTAEGIHFTLFPDNQPHVNIKGVDEGDEIKVICSLTDSIKMMHLLQTANALDNLFAKKKVLVIPYLMAARFDRLMQHGDSIDLKVVANLVNSCGFEKVFLFDVHSDVASLLINNAVAISNKQLVEQYNQPDALLICPDAGAAKKINKYFEWNKNLKDVVYCSKNRDLSTGNLALEVLEPKRCEGRNVAIIDDICDGGATFLSIAEKINAKHLALIVTHGIFSKGFSALEKRFNEIIVSDSYCKKNESRIVRMLTVNYADF